MSERFFSVRRIDSDRATLDGSEAHHLLHVMRASVGDQVTLFDGTGAEFDAIVEVLRRSDAELRVTALHEIDRELPFPLTLGVALPKGDRQRWLVEKLTELGVAMLVPLITERSVAQPNHNALDRLRRAVIEAAKQCGRNRLMKIAGPQAWDTWLTTACLGSSDREPPTSRRLFGHPSGSPLGELGRSQFGPTYLAIGPEGGLTDSEIAAATAARWQSVSLGPRILRVETAAIALAAAIALR